MIPITFDSCPICQCGDLEYAFQSDKPARQRFLHLSRIKYQGVMDGWESSLSLDIRRCQKCGHFWHHTQPDQDSLWEIYGKSRPLVTTIKRTESTEPSPYICSEMRRVRRLLGRGGKEKPAFLDYGSGAGLWSRAAVNAGFEVTAYEPCSARSDLAGASADIMVVNHLAPLEGGVFDVINLEQVLEHTQAPIEVLTSLRKYAHEETILRISVPNVAIQASRGGLWADFPFDGKTIHVMSPYEHLQGFFPSSLKMALEKTGLVQLRGLDILAVDPLNWVRWKIGRVLPFLAQTKVYARFRWEGN